MGYEHKEIDQSRVSLPKALGLMVTGGAAAALLLTSIGLWQSGSQFFNQIGASLQSFWQPVPPSPQVDVQAIVLQQIREASELTTAAFTMQAVVPTSQDAALGGFVIGTTKLLYIAYGEVQAGVDLSQLTPENVQIRGDQIQLRLPPPKILDSKIDVNKSQVYDYNRGMLGLGPDVAPELQSLAQQKALQKITAAACSNGLLEKASDRARLVVTQLLSTAGYQAVNVEIQAPLPGTCPQEPVATE